jgi:hypothetical protein
VQVWQLECPVSAPARRRDGGVEWSWIDQGPGIFSLELMIGLPAGIADKNIS